MKKLALALLVCLMAVPSVAQAKPTSAKLHVTGRAVPDVYGVIKSEKKSCAKDRKVTVYEQKYDSHGHPKKPKRLGSGLASAPTSGFHEYMFYVGGFTHGGSYFATVKKEHGCSHEKSKVVGLSG